MNNLSKILRSYLDHHNLSLRKFTMHAEKVNKDLGNEYTLSHTAIDNMIKNNSSTTVQSFEYLANALNITTDELLLMSGFIISKDIEKKTFLKLSNNLNIPFDELLEISGYTEDKLVRREKESKDLKRFIIENKLRFDNYELSENDKEKIIDAIMFTINILKKG